ncbi:MAG: glycosyltransferase [Methylacidiphilales bacterium]|nr:glycosyltransferase [Candidatus Methylacidiphilales bacterium]
MDSPRYTVIVPMSRFRADEPVLASLRDAPPPKGGLQILVAEGGHPARQRNAALGRAKGEILIFLDNDCSINSGYWEELEKALARTEVDIVGGPALLRPGATAWEEIFHALLTHALIVGTVSSRYAARGEFRVATQTDLILCNLAVRRSIFEKVGRLSTDLYPNEENEWLDRSHAAGVGAYYDPNLQVFRPQRTTPGAMALTLLRYGMGRTRQFRVSGWRPTFHQFLPVMLIATFVALFHWHLETDFVALWLLASVIIAFTCNLPRLWQRIVAGLIAPLIPLTYAVGQGTGWIALILPAPAMSSEVVLRNERGERI